MKNWGLGLICVVLPLAAAIAAQQPYDIVIRNGHIIDGTGSPWYRADIGIRNGHITAIGKLDSVPARRVIDANERVVAPGFIDMLGQSELTILVDPHLPSKIFQGITTEITGEGKTPAPLTDAFVREHPLEYQQLHITPDWRSLDQYFARLKRQGMGINMGVYVGATQVRELVLGDKDVAPSPGQLREMQALVRQAMLQGAMGVSSALEYTPAPYAGTEELIALAKEAAEFGGTYATHVRDEGAGEMAALDEAIRIGREADIPVEIFHIKAAGKANFGKMPEVVAKVEAARASGVDVAADTYAYPAWSNDLSAFVPPWAHAGGDAKLLERLRDPAQRARIRKDMETPGQKWDNEWQEIEGPQGILVGEVHNPALRNLQGRTLSDIAAAWKEDPIDALCDLLIRDDAFTKVAVFAISEPDIVLALQQRWVSVDTDSSGTSPTGLLGEAHPHPRAYGTFARILSKYVHTEGTLTLPDAIRKFSALPAQRMRLTDRGVLKVGMWADIVVFDPARVRDVATYADPNRPSVGMDYVLVNGVPVIAAGKATGALPGKVLRGPGYVPAHVQPR